MQLRDPIRAIHASRLTDWSLHMFRLGRGRKKKPLHTCSAESRQRQVEGCVQQKRLKVIEVPGVSASTIRMFMWPRRCMEGSGGELTS